MAPVFSVIDVRARIVPLKLVVVPSVAELPTFQKTLHAEAPLTSFTWLADAVMSVDAAWKTKTASLSPCASSVRVPVRSSAPPL